MQNFIQKPKKQYRQSITQPQNHLTQAVTQPKIHLTQPKNALTQFTGNYVVCICRKSVEKNPAYTILYELLLFISLQPPSAMGVGTSSNVPLFQYSYYLDVLHNCTLHTLRSVHMKYFVSHASGKSTMPYTII